VTGAYVLLGFLALTLTLAGLHRRHDGRLRQTRAVSRATATAGALAGTAADTREDLRPLLPTAGERATLLQFSSAFCAPCRATRRVLGDVAAVAAGVAHVEIDAESNLELVRKLNILKTPTTLVLDERGREVLRASGQPNKADVLRALGQAVPS